MAFGHTKSKSQQKAEGKASERQCKRTRKKKKGIKLISYQNISSCLTQEVRTFIEPYHPGEILDRESPLYPRVHIITLSRLHAFGV